MIRIKFTIFEKEKKYNLVKNSCTDVLKIVNFEIFVCTLFNFRISKIILGVLFIHY